MPDSAAALVTAALGMASFSMCGLYCNHADLSPRYAPFLLGMTNTVGALPGIVGELHLCTAATQARPCTSCAIWRARSATVHPKLPWKRASRCGHAAWHVAVACCCAFSSNILVWTVSVPWPHPFPLPCLHCTGVAVTGALLDATGSWEWALFAPSILFFVTGTAVFVHYGRSEQQQFDNNTEFW